MDGNLHRQCGVRYNTLIRKSPMEGYEEQPLPPTPRDTMIALLSRWAGVQESSLAKYETEELRNYFNRASDPSMCRVALAASTVFAAAAAVSYVNGHPVDTACMVFGSVLDGWGALYHMAEMKKVRAELSGPK